MRDIILKYRNEIERNNISIFTGINESESSSIYSCILSAPIFIPKKRKYRILYQWLRFTSSHYKVSISIL